ncbi:hypothetical protein KC19_VG145900 [Ceratodon purpureus]|uniref:Uncharacterized protein n=1 Tax=Ceratodon purpureus TaxID=3225 RepID=A0A8T0HR92_CERPU|nr:hypothetical protein KC19_VG145900 [Ceratodon purpureus]
MSRNRRQVGSFSRNEEKDDISTGDLKYLLAMRLFIGEPIWTLYNRRQDEHSVRL